MDIELDKNTESQAIPDYLLKVPCGASCGCELKEKKKKCCKKFKKGKRCGSCPKV
jgi:hypothetical protein